MKCITIEAKKMKNEINKMLLKFS